MRINTLCILLLLVGGYTFTLNGQCPSSDPGYIILDFETDANGDSLVAGQIIDDQTYAAWGIELYSLTSAGNPASSANPLVIFDSSNPTGGDCDLGTPSFHCPDNVFDLSNDCAGDYPGQSNEAGLGGGQNNCVAEHNILIIEENFTDVNNDNLDDDPDDLGGGGIIRLEFSNPYNLQKIHFVDDAEGEIHVTFSDNTTQTVSFNVGLDNDVFTVVFNLLDVISVDIDLMGSGGFASIELCDLVTGAIGDQLFIDTDCNDIYDPNIDYPISDVTVNLTKPDNSVVSVTTDENGFYEFVDLLLGTYTVTVDTNDPDFPAGITPSYDVDGIGTPNSSTVTISDGIPISNVDFAYKGLGSISNQLYYDINGNNTYQDGVDPGLGNVDVKIIYSNGYTATKTTNASGQYIFNDLPAGDYTVMVDANDSDFPSASTPVYDYDGTATPNTSDYTLGASENNVEQDFGYRGTGSISNQLFIDMNTNDSYEPGADMVIPDVDMQITYCNGYSTTTTTDNNGTYIFDNLPACNYTIAVLSSDPDFPSGVTPSVDYDGIASAHSAMFDLADGQNTVLVDFGYRGLGSISNQLYYDINGNNTYQDGVDPGLVNVDVKLTYSNGYEATKTTDALGQYIFDNLPAGDYTVMVDTNDPDFPSSSTPVYDYDGTVTANTSDYSLGAAENNVEQDFGYRGTGSISNQLFIDLNNNDLFDAGVDMVISNVDVQLTYCNNYSVKQATDNTGQYLFDNLPACEYTITVLTADPDFPAGVSPIFDYDGITTASTSLFDLADGQNTVLVDFGYRGSGSISNQLYYDINGNDTYQDGIDPGLKNVEVKLIYNNGYEVTQSTDALGQYIFNDLPAGDYTVTVNSNDSDFPSFSTPVYDYDGTSSINTSDVTLGPGENNVEQDFGYRGTGSISNQLFIDISNNNIYDLNKDLIIANVDVELTYCNGFKLTVSSDANGEYYFGDLPPCENYIVTVKDSDPDFPSGINPSYDKDGTATAHTTAVNLLDSENKIDVDFGYQGSGSISNLLYVDMNYNSTFEPLDDVVIPFIDVELIDNNGTSIYTATDASGDYIFDFLPPGTYTVSVMIDDSDFPENIVAKSDYDGINSANTTTINLGMSEDNVDVDFVYAEVVLPVVWDKFYGEISNQDVHLYWSTYSESNSSHYIIERSDNGSQFKPIDRVNASGTTTDYNSYRYIDHNLNSGTYYYRLLQVDYDGRINYSEMISVNLDVNSDIRIYPNPVQNRLYISIDLDDNYNVEVMEAASGRQINQQRLNKDFIDMSELDAGVYLIRFSNANMIKTLPFVKM